MPEVIDLVSECSDEDMDSHSGVTNVDLEEMQVRKDAMFQLVIKAIHGLPKLSLSGLNDTGSKTITLPVRQRQ